MALLTVLLLVAVMSVLAVSVLDDIRFGVRRTANAAEVGQAQWYAIGAEQLAAVQIRRLSALTPGRTLAVGGWNGRVFSYPVEGGVIRARLQDGGNCFDLNSLVQGAPGAWAVHPPGVLQFQTLLVALGTPQPEAEAVSGALLDWMDVDGPDDAAYAQAVRPYSSGGAPLAEVSELRAVRGVTPELYARLRPYVCALPLSEFVGFGFGASGRLSPVNVNTVREDQAVLLTVITAGVLQPDEARRWIASRPAGGWDPTTFLSHPLLVETPPPGLYGQLMSGARTRFFTLEATVDYGVAEVAMSSLLEQDDSGAVRLLARRWTVDE